MDEISRVFRDERGRILATLIRVLGDFDLAEEALAAALEAAVRQWPRDGVPQNPRAWLIRAARNKGVDGVRRRVLAEARRPIVEEVMTPEEEDDHLVQDDQLRLIFTCCHPAIAVEAQVALTLRTLAGLSTDEIARAFLVPPATMAQRLVRVKHKIRLAGIPYRLPDEGDLPERLSSVMAVVYLIFNEGYAATSGDDMVRTDLAADAIRLARLLCELLPAEPGPLGLLALMLLHDGRRAARVDANGDVVLLEDQDRGGWDRGQIDEGLELLDRRLRFGQPDGYTLQAAIAALHAQAARPEHTDWRQIAALYRRLYFTSPSPVVLLNHAAAVAMAEGPGVGLVLLDQLAASGVLDGYHLLPAARADLLRRLGRTSEAASAYRAALSLVGNEPERRYLERRLRDLVSD